MPIFTPPSHAFAQRRDRRATRRARPRTERKMHHCVEVVTNLPLRRRGDRRVRARRRCRNDSGSSIGSSIDSEATAGQALAVAADDRRAGPRRQHARARRPAHVAAEEWKCHALTEDVAVHHQRQQVVLRQRAPQFAIAVFRPDRVHGQFAFRVAHGAARANVRVARPRPRAPCDPGARARPPPAPSCRCGTT